MKKNKGKKVAIGVSLILLVGVVIGLASFSKVGVQVASFFGNDSSSSLENPGEESDNPADDLAGALEYEFNMTKNPKTGKIPEGIFDAERAQANRIADLQGDQPDFASYNFIGPDNLGGRSRSVVYDVRYNGGANQTILACGISNGVFKSVDNGATWVRKSPAGQHFSCTSLAQDTRAGFQDTWYYAVGEGLGNSVNASGAFYLGNGVYKSINNGETWARLPNSNPGTLEVFDRVEDLITKIAVDPTNGNVFMASIASIKRSLDGGDSWATVLTGAASSASQSTDVVITSTGIIYAALSGNAGNNADGVHRSTNGGAAFTKIAGTGSPNTPAGWNAANNYGRVVLATAPSDVNRVYALYYDNTTSNCGGVPKPEAEFYYWNNATTTWTAATLPDEPGCLNGNDPFAAQGGYDLVVAVKPDAANTVFIGGTNSYRSIDAGLTWTRIGGYNDPNSYNQYPNSHPDIHAFAFQPGTPTTMLSGDDGGIQRTTNNLAGAVAWNQINNGFRTYQYYYVVNDPRIGNNKVIGGAQDNGTTRNIGGSGSNFEQVFSGDGVSVGLSDPAASGGVQYEYVGAQNGIIFRRAATLPDGFGDDIKPALSGAGIFVTLFKLDPDNTQTLYYASNNNLYQTTSASTVTPATWTQMTGIGAAAAGSDISAIGMTRGAYNPLTASLFVGTSDGRLFRLDNPNVAPVAPPVNITGAGFPPNGFISSIAVSPTNDDTVLVTFSSYSVTSVFYTNNANAAAPTWTNAEGNLTLPSFRSSSIVNVNGVLEYYVGTSAGLFRTTGLPGVPTWTQESSDGIGNAVVSSLDLRTSDNKLLVGTHGYGMWAAPAVTAAGVDVEGRVAFSSGFGLGNSSVNLTDSNGQTRTAKTSSFGHFKFEEVQAGETYTVTVSHKRYKFTPQVITVNNNVTNLNLTPIE